MQIKTEKHLYELLKKRDLGVISVGHRPTLIEFHSSVLELLGNGNWRLLPSSGYDFENR